MMQAVDAAGVESDPAEAVKHPAQRARPQPKTNKRLHVEMDGQDYQLVVSVAPVKEGHLYVRPLTGGPRRLALATALKLRGFVSR